MAVISIDGWEPPHLSYSTISSYRMCGTKLYLSKIARVEERPGLAALAGNVIHGVCDSIDEFILEHGIDALPQFDA